MSYEDNLRQAAAIIDALYQSRLSPEQFNERAIEVNTVLSSVMYSSDNDEVAERYYQLSRLSKLAGIRNVFGDADSRLYFARDYLQKAVDYSRRGSGIKRAFYEAELANF